MDSNQLRELIKRSEGPKLDFKKEFHKINHHDRNVKQRQWDELIRDLLSLANGNVGTAHETAYLIVGVEDKTKTLFDVSDEVPDIKQVLQKVNSACTPSLPDLDCTAVLLDGKRLIVFSIPPTPYLYETTRVLETKENKRFQENTVFARRGEEIYIPSFEECLVIRQQKEQWSHTQEPESIRAINMADNPPEDFVPRSDLFKQLLDLLLDQETGKPRGTTVALCGFGGFGKTTLAKALCHHKAIEQAFENGILWITLGESPNKIATLTTLYVRLADERPKFVGEEDAVQSLKEKLSERNCLLVIDDVMHEDDMKLLLQASYGCGRLITTRDRNALPSDVSTSKIIDVGRMEDTEALELLRKDIGSYEDEIVHKLHHMATRQLRSWPLLLKIVNRVVRNHLDRGMSLDEALSNVEKDLNEFGLPAFDPDDADDRRNRDRAVAATIEVSLRVLETVVSKNKHYLNARSRFEELAIFPKDREIPLPVLEKLWNLSGNLTSGQVRRLCNRLADLSLLQTFKKDIIRPHDVIHDYLAQELEGKLLPVHSMLLNAYRADLTNNSWATLPHSEPYIWDYLVYHLNKAGYKNELFQTIINPMYLVKKMQVRSISAVEYDLQIADENLAHKDDISLLRHTIATSSHLLNRIKIAADQENIKPINLLAITLCSRLSHFTDLHHLMHPFAGTIARPYLIPWHPLPDLPHTALRRSIPFDDTELASCAITTDNDENIIVVASSDGKLRVHDASSGRERHTIEILKTARNEITQESAPIKPPAWSFSPDTFNIVAIKDDGTVGLWDARSGKQRKILPGKIEGEIGCAISSDGTIVAAFSANKLYIWNTRGDASPTEYSISEKQFQNCAISLTGRIFIAVGSQSAPDVSILEVIGGNLIPIFDDQDIFKIIRLSSCENDSFLLSATLDHSIKVTNIPKHSIDSFLSGHTDKVHDCTTNVKGNIVVSASEDCTVKVWNMQGDLQLSLDDHAQPVHFCALSPEGTVALSTSVDKTLRIWNTQNVNVDLLPARRIRGMQSCAVSRNGRTVISATRDGRLTLWDPHTDSILPDQLRSAEQSSGICDINVDGTRIISATVSGTLNVWDIFDEDPEDEEDAENTEFDEDRYILHFSLGSNVESKQTNAPLQQVTSCTMNPSATIVVAGTSTGTVKIWNLSENILITRQIHTDTIYDCVFDETGTKVVTASSDQTLGICDVDGNPLIAPLKGHHDSVNSCAISVDGTVIVSASEDRTLKIWDAHAGTERFTLVGHASGVKGCSISSNGQHIVSVADDGMIIVWSAITGELLTALMVDGSLADCAWLPGEMHIVAVGERGMYLLTLET